MAHKISDRRGQDRPKPCCRVCGAPEEHSKEYNSATMKCIEYFRTKANEFPIQLLEEIKMLIVFKRAALGLSNRQSLAGDAYTDIIKSVTDIVKALQELNELTDGSEYKKHMVLEYIEKQGCKPDKKLVDTWV